MKIDTFENKQIRLDIVVTPKGVYEATSVDVRGLYVFSKNVDTLIAKAARTIEELYAASGKPVTVLREAVEPDEDVNLYALGTNATIGDDSLERVGSF